ncbi:two-component system, sensor histidine kinase YesM [Fictibacillus solisalsi]|uniref:Two-component system, sensor histidine kinase YesM n=1 Tax=Fictibacillus solisalsi TaxID=459525 RepID=A0A1H0C3N1_9BACL|nr:sensor histidine kinase [Fictibacillus solisalsi]SDN52478.1 two-component system, sensor histidine kinase YesM [Fictibacillus solisalsi]
MKTIRGRLLLMLVLFILIPYFLTVLILYGVTKNSVEKHELENSRAQMQKNAEELQQYFGDLVDLPYILYRNPDLFRIFQHGFKDSIYLDQSSMEKSLETFYLMRKEIRQLRFYIARDKESFTVYNAIVSTRKHKPDVLKEKPVQHLLHSKQTYIIEPPHPLKNYNNVAIVPQSDNTSVLTIHHKIKDILSGKFLGIMTMDINLSTYSSIIEKVEQKNGASVLLIDNNNQVIFGSDRSLIGKEVPASLQRKMDAPKSKANIIFSKTLSGPLGGWKLVKITPGDVLFSNVRKTAYTNILIGLGVGLLGLLMIGFISYRITRPIQELSGKVRSIEGGKMDVSFDTSRKDEIGHLETHIQEMMHRINLHIDREYKLEIENRKNQLRALKSQVNPHFLFNALQSIGAVAVRSRAPRVYQLLTSLSKMMRYSIQANQWVMVKDEVAYIRAYLILQQERFGRSLNYSIELSDQIMQLTIPSMILQPLVENFFKHAYEKTHQAHLSIFGALEQEFLFLYVENNGPTLCDEALQEVRKTIYTSPVDGDLPNEHIGLKNIYDRLLLNYGPNVRLEIDTLQGKGFSVKLSIPLSEPTDGKEDGHESFNR